MITSLPEHFATLSRVIEDSGVSLEIILLIRGFVTRLISRYSFFYANIIAGLVVQVPIYFSQAHAPKLYPTIFWDAQFLTMLTGCGIIIEVLRGTVSTAVRLKLVTDTLYTYIRLVCIWLAVAYVGNRSPGHGLQNIVLERNFRMAQAVGLLGLTALVLYFGIPVGRNLKGLLLGYGLYVGVSLVTLSVWSYREPHFNPLLALVEPLFYVVALLIWTIALWTYHPDRALEPGSQLALLSNSPGPQSKGLNKAVGFRLTKAVGS